MRPRQQSAGAAGIVGGLFLAVAFVLLATSGASPDTFSDPAKGLQFASQNSGRLRAISILAIIAVAFFIPFIAGLAGRLYDGAPTRSTAVLYFGLLGLAFRGFYTLMFYAGFPALVASAARDQVAASHAWVASDALLIALDGIGRLFLGLSALLAGWAIVTTKALSGGLGWFSMLTGILLVLAALVPAAALFFGSSVLLIIWFVWAGSALRKAPA